MKKAVLLQSPAHLYEVVPIFYREANKFNYFDIFYIVTNAKEAYGLGSNCQVITLERDFGRGNNFLKALPFIKEDIFVMMCDDHVIQQDALNLDEYYSIMNSDTSIGRMQLSPPSSNYHMYYKKNTGRPFVLDTQEKFQPYLRGYRFYVNFQPSLWRKDFFAYCIQEGQNRNKLELAAAIRGRKNKEFVSGFIPRSAITVGNFYASCMVHSADPKFDRGRDMAHYREEFVTYAKKHNLPLDKNKRVYVKRKGFTASVPVEDYIAGDISINALSKWEIRQPYLQRLINNFLYKLRNGISALLGI